MELSKYNIDCSKKKTRPVYEKRYKKNGEEYLKKVDEIDIEEDLKEKKLEVSRIKEIFNNKERIKIDELVDEYTEETKQKELELMQNYENLDTYAFLNKTMEIQTLYNKMPENVRMEYKNLSRFTKEYLPEFTKQTKKRIEEINQNKNTQQKQETLTQTREEIQNQINELQKKLGENENV